MLFVEMVPVNEPEEALIVPEISTPVAVNNPVLVTLNGAVDAVEPPSQSRYAGSLEESLATVSPAPTVMSPELSISVSPPVSEVDDSVHPPIAPDVAVTEPLIVAPVAVSSPVLVTRNGAEDAVVPPSHRRYAGSLEDIRAMFSPVPIVMSPALLITESPPVRDVDERVQPPTVPDVALIDPVDVTLNGAADPVEWPSQSL
jgi:hypothetical protein